MRQRLRICTNQLGQISSLLLHEILHGVQLVPQFALHFGHVGPGVHAVRLDVLDFPLGLLLLLRVAFVVLQKISFFRTLNYYLRHFLRGLDLSDLHLILEPLLYDLGN